MLHKKYFIILLLIIVVLSCRKNIKSQNNTIHSNNIVKAEENHVSENKPEKKKPVSHISPYSFTKGIYLNAYTVASKKFLPILDSAAAAGINTIVFDLKNMNGHIFFKVPLKQEKKGRLKPIVDISSVVNILHERKMRAVGRIVMFHDQFSAEQDSTLRPKNKQTKEAWKESKRRKASWLDPSQPRVQKELINIIEDAAKSGIDEIQLDYIRFPTQGNLKNAEFYYEREDSLIALRDSTYEFRNKTDIIENFVKKVKKICSKHNIMLTGDIFAIVAWQREADVKNTGQDIKRLTKYLDAIHPMIYSSHFADNFGFRKNVSNEPYYIVFKGTKLTKRYSKPTCRIIPYIQANSWKVNYKPAYIYAQIGAVVDAKADGYILWNASNKYFKTLNWIKEYNNKK